MVWGAFPDCTPILRDTEMRSKTFKCRELVKLSEVPVALSGARMLIVQVSEAPVLSANADPAMTPKAFCTPSRLSPGYNATELEATGALSYVEIGEVPFGIAPALGVPWGREE